MNDINVKLGLLARQYRSSANRAKIIQEYADEVNRLIQTGNWDEMPNFEDQLVDEDMPSSYFKYWNIPSL